MRVGYLFILAAAAQALCSVVLTKLDRAPEANTMLLWAVLNLNVVIAWHVVGNKK